MQTYKRCDLHVHSSSCESRPYSYEDFEKTLLGSDLDVIAITDHNSVDVELMNRLSASLSAKDKTLLAGVELNVKIDEKTIKKHNLVVSPSSEYFHGIIWCDLVDAEKLREAVFRLLDGIDISAQQRAGKSAKEISALSTGQAFFLEDIQREMGDLKHFFTFHESKGDNRRNLSGYLKNGKGGNDKFKESLFYYNQHLAVEGGKKSKPISDFFEEDLNTMVCRFFCSDAKSLGEIGTKFTWIDFDGDIDSLNLAITDPQSRIATSDECQSNPQTNLNAYLESVRFNLLDSKHNASECEIEFAPSYNGIVGSRGSGKSMLARILSGQLGGDYSKYVDPESVYFRMKGGQYSKNLPKFLYIKQGELGAVFDDADYKSVPFLDSRLKEMKESAQSTSGRHYADAVAQLDHQKELVDGFIEKHNGSLKRPDALLRMKPSGISIAKAPSVHSDQSNISNAGSQVKQIGDQLEALEEDISNLTINDSFPEASRLISALNTRANHAAISLKAAIDDLADISAAIDQLESEPFATREFLLSSFASEIADTNKSKSLGVHNYDRNIEEANEFLDDLLELRMQLQTSNKKIEDSIARMLRPIPPKVYQADKDTVVIGLTIAKTISYEDSFKSQFKGGAAKFDAIAKFVLQCADLAKAKQNLLNGVKFRGCPSTISVIEKLYGNIESDLSKNEEFDIDVAFNGMPAKEMSPGMQAQVLLKLLLNDELLSGDYDYVVFDQPEDNLDTPTISEVLVDRIKRLKKGVQVFVVSHSAPVIINGDARNIVMAENTGSSISYSSGVINEWPAKKFISEVLDGGERFLKMRLYKYDFQVGDKDDKSE